jgi:hypothetical protein
MAHQGFFLLDSARCPMIATPTHGPRLMQPVNNSLKV